MAFGLVSKQRYNQLAEEFRKIRDKENQLKNELRGQKISNSKQKNINADLKKKITEIEKKLKTAPTASDITKFIATFDPDGNVKFKTEINDEIIEFMISNGYIESDHADDESMHYLALILMTYDMLDQYIESYTDAVHELEEGNE